MEENARRLNAGGANGGPLALAAQSFFIGINDPLGGNPFHTPFHSKIFNLFDAWAGEIGFTEQEKNDLLAFPAEFVKMWGRRSPARLHLEMGLLIY